MKFIILLLLAQEPLSSLGVCYLCALSGLLQGENSNQEAPLPLCYLWYVLVSWLWVPQQHLRQMISSFYLFLPNKTNQQVISNDRNEQTWGQVLSLSQRHLTCRLELFKRLRNYKKFKLMVISCEAQMFKNKFILFPSNCSYLLQCFLSVNGIIIL